MYYNIKRLRAQINPMQVSSVIPNGENFDIIMGNGSRYNITADEHKDFNAFIDGQRANYFSPEREAAFVDKISGLIKQ